MFLGMCLEVLTLQKFFLCIPKLCIDYMLHALNHVKYGLPIFLPQEEGEN